MVATLAHLAVHSTTILPASLQEGPVSTTLCSPTSCARNFARARVGSQSRGLGYGGGLRSQNSLLQLKYRDAVLRAVYAGCGGPAKLRVAAPRASLVQKVTAKELEDILSGERPRPILVDFYATWCGPCLALSKILDKLSVEYEGLVRFVKLDTDEEAEFAEYMGIQGLPTLYFVSPDRNKRSVRSEGLVPEQAIRDILEKEFEVPPAILTN